MFILQLFNWFCCRTIFLEDTIEEYLYVWLKKLTKIIKFHQKTLRNFQELWNTRRWHGHSGSGDGPQRTMFADLFCLNMLLKCTVDWLFDLIQRCENYLSWRTLLQFYFCSMFTDLQYRNELMEMEVGHYLELLPHTYIHTKEHHILIFITIGQLLENS